MTLTQGKEILLRTVESSTVGLRVVKYTPIYNYAARRWQFAVGKRTQNGITQYRDADGTVFTSMDTDPTRHSVDIETTLSPDDIAFFVALAKEAPAECLRMASELPQDLKAQLQTSFRNPKNFSPEEHTALKQAAVELRNSTQPVEDGHRQAEGGAGVAQVVSPKPKGIPVAPEGVTVVSLLHNPEWMHIAVDQSTYRYVGKMVRRHKLSKNILSAKAKQSRNDWIKHVLIPCLEAGRGGVWDELQGLKVSLKRKGCLVLGVWDVERLEHAEVLKMVVVGLAAGEAVDSTIKKLRALLPVKQSVLLGV